MTTLLCRCAAYRRLDPEKVALAEKEAAVQVVDDLCALCASSPETVRGLSFERVLGCEPRALKSLLAFAGHSTEGVVFESLRAPDTLVNPPKPETGWAAWYPVLDRERCTNCRKCADFCLFGVYEVVGGEVRVSAPEKCKTNCPACARICPNGAVIFPKHGSAPVHGGGDSPSPDAGTALEERLRFRRAERNPNRLFKDGE